MSSHDRRLCPGVGGRKCGVYMSPVFRDPHPTCSRCRGRQCSSESKCSTCHDWSLAQWEAFHNKRSYAERKKSNSHHAGIPTSLASDTPFSSAPVKQAALHLRPFPPPLLQRGLGQGKRRKVKALSEHVCPPLPPLPSSQQGERGGTRTMS